MIRRIVLAAAALVALTAPASADPNLRIYNFLDEDAEVYLDYASKANVQAGHLLSITVEPGNHTFALTTPSGASLELDVTLDTAAMATAQDGNWWCVVIDKDGEVTLALYTQPQCQGLTDAHH
jgi:hypothetical protein